MPRKKKVKAAAPTYFKAKNGRFYKKVQIDGKTRVRFVTNAEATGAMTVKQPKRSRKAKAKAKPKEPEVEPITDDEKQES